MDQAELAQLVRSLGVKRVEAGATTKQGSSDDRRFGALGKVKITRDEEAGTGIRLAARVRASSSVSSPR